MIKTIILDFDGVILDSNHIKEQAFSDMYQNYGSKIVNQVIQFHKENLGVSRYNKFRYFNKNFLKIESNDNELELLSKKFSKIVFQRLIQVNFIKGSYKFISNNYKKYDLHISSATPETELLQICKKRKIQIYFKSINGYPLSKKKTYRINN